MFEKCEGCEGCDLVLFLGLSCFSGVLSGSLRSRAFRICEIAV
jgi:hypothetical protein